MGATTFQDIDEAWARLGELKREKDRLEGIKSKATHSPRGWESQDEREQVFAGIADLSKKIAVVQIEVDRLLAEGQRPRAARRTGSAMTCPECGGPAAVAGEPCDGCMDR